MSTRFAEPYWAAQKYMGNVPCVAKAATDKMTNDMSHELREYNVAVVSLYPGLVRTEKVMEPAALVDLSNSLSNSESPEFVGRAVAALSADARLSSKSGRVLTTADLAKEYGFTDVDGKRPKPVDLESVQ
jgi:NAD(P)-dependent dehydrogenase (short-subunit alcohol dehydrogenase family)